MILAIDVGNTNIVIGVIDKDKQYFESRIVTDTETDSTAYGEALREILSGNNINADELEGAIISSVVPKLYRVMSNAVKDVTGHVAIEVSHKIKTGLKLGDNAHEIGSDLLVGSVAALNEFEAPIIIIDMGTATTFWVIDCDGVPCGGAFVPGLNLSLEALAGKTAQLPSVELSDMNTVIGRNTTDCIKSGIIYGTAAMIDGMVARIEDELGKSATVIATGGHSGKVIPHCKRKDIIRRDDMLIRGLWILYEMNK